MATLSAPFLNPAAQEDSMELSSPGNRPLDEDIDIDIDGDFGAADTHDEQMGDDTEQQDDLVEDEDMLQLEDNIKDTTTTDPPRFSTIADEDLIDYSDDEDMLAQPVSAQQEDTATTDIAQSLEEPHAEPNSTVSGIDSSVALEADLPADSIALAAQITAANDSEDVLDPLAGTNADDAPNNVQAAVSAPDLAQPPAVASLEASADSGAAYTENTVSVDSNAAQLQPTEFLTQHESSTLAQAESAESVPEEGVLKPRLSTTSLVPPTEGPGTPTDTGLHPVILYYADQAYPLFRSRSSTDGLLKDDNLASISLADLIKACRQSLVIRTQQDIDVSLELVLTFDNLSLSVYEDAPAAFQTSLQEVLDVYLQLQFNDGHEDHDIPPLEISCTLQIKFNNSIVVLRNAAERGEGLSSIIPQHVEEQDQEDIDHEETDEEDYHEENTAASQGDAEEENEQEDPTGSVEHQDNEPYVEGKGAEEEHETYNEDQAFAASQDNDAETEAAEITDAVESTLPALSDADTPDALPALDAADPNTPAADQTQTAHDLTSPHDQDAEPIEPAVDINDDARTEEPFDESAEHAYEEGLHDDNAEELFDQTAEDGLDESTAAATSPAPIEHLEVTEVKGDTANSEFEFDLEDYEAPDPSITASPSAKRQREADDVIDSTGSTKKLRPF